MNICEFFGSGPSPRLPSSFRVKEGYDSHPPQPSLWCDLESLGFVPLPTLVSHIIDHFPKSNKPSRKRRSGDRRRGSGTGPRPCRTSSRRGQGPCHPPPGSMERTSTSPMRFGLSIKVIGPLVKQVTPCARNLISITNSSTYKHDSEDYA